MVTPKSAKVIKGDKSKNRRYASKQSREMYLVRTCDEVVNRYMPLIYDFVEGGNKFIVASHDRAFIQTFKTALEKELHIAPDCYKLAKDMDQTQKDIKRYLKRKKLIFIFMEHVFNGQSTLQFVRFVKNEYTGIAIVSLGTEVDQDRLVLFHEMGADNFITKPVSVNVLIEKIAYTLEPQGALNVLVKRGKDLIVQEKFEQAVETAEAILEKKPGSSAGLMIMGDALLGMGKREDALEAYETAADNADMYLEPIKKIANLYSEQGDNEKYLECLMRLDALSPLNLDRKINIGELQVNMGQVDEAERYFDEAIDQAHQEAMTMVGDMSRNIAEVLLEIKPDLSEKYFRRSIEAQKKSKANMHPVIYNRLGIALRKQKKWKQAIEEYKEAVKLAPNDENIRYNIAMAYAEGKDFENAAANIEKALDLNPNFYKDSPVAAYNIAIIYQKRKRTADAIKFLEHVLEIDPDFRDARYKYNILTQKNL